MKALTMIIAVLLATWSPMICAAGEPPALSHNPFSRPPSEVLRIDRRISGSDDANARSLTLLATMTGQATALANVAGHILALGDEIEGYTLKSVHEEYAVFVKDGRYITVYVNPNSADEDG